MRRFLIPPLLAFASLVSYGQRAPNPPAAPPPAAPTQAGAPPAAPAAPAKLEEKTSITEHTLHIGGQALRYSATAGTVVLKKEDGTPTASIFYIAYVKQGVTDASTRPLTFAFNGGPGSSSVWLHMGSLGPKRVLMEPEGAPTPPPYRFIDNEYSILDVTDLVFIDPVSTGYSRAATDAEARNFHGFTGDIQSVGEFIRLWTTRNARWTSPKFLAGESYGTTRASALSGYLQETLGLNLNGIVLISAILNFQTTSFAVGNDLAYPLFLPTYTATAWYHKKLPKDLQSAGLKEAIAESRGYAAGDYTLALMKGDAIPAAERRQIAQRLARLTGLSATFIDESNLRVPIFRFTKELLRDERRTVGRFDSRMKGIDSDAAGERPDYDPSYATVQGPYTAAWNQYVRSELKFETDLPYEILTGRVRPWSYREYENRYVNVAETLRQAMTQNPSLKVFVANGYYDLATPFFAAEYTFNHMSLDPALRANVSMGFYEAGHMMYTQLKSLQQSKEDIAKFVASCLPPAPATQPARLTP
jgi:carboxypeptidase C (cathepsin A)